MKHLSKYIVNTKVILGFSLLVIFFWGVSVRNDSPISPEIPIVGSESPAFSLEAQIVRTVDIDPVYLLEYRGSPNYRILRFDGSSGELSTIFTVPVGSLVYGMALNPSGDRLAVGFTEDYGIDGNGVYVLDLEDNTSTLTNLIPHLEGRYIVDLDWAADDRLLASASIPAEDSTDVVEIDVNSAELTVVAENGVDPIATNQGFAFLPLEDDRSRRSVNIYSYSDRSIRTLDVFSAEYDLDNLLFDSENEQVYVSALNRSNGISFQLGTQVFAHGSHSIPSSWVRLSGPSFTDIVDSALGSTLVFDAALTEKSKLLEITNDGLYISSFDGSREQIIKSRALRFIAY